MKKIVIASIATLALVTAASAAVNGKACAACHGVHFEKHALRISKIVANMTHAEIAEALKGFKARTFKGVMKGQVARYSDAELEAFAQTIGK